MRPGAVKVESNGSYWWFDETNHEYMRLPKNERPRDHPSWGGPDAGVLQDAVWHRYALWALLDEHDGPNGYRCPAGLYISYDDGGGRTCAPTDLIAQPIATQETP